MGHVEQMHNDDLTHLLLHMKCDEMKLLMVNPIVVSSLAISCGMC